MPAGAFTFVLHSHIPWVLHHGRWPHGVDWLNEAVAETYLPLWRVLHERAQDGQSLGVTLGLTPVLCEQLAHPDFHREFVSYVEQKLAAAAEDRVWFTRSGESALAVLAVRWERFYRASLEDFMGPHGPNLVARFRRLEERSDRAHVLRLSLEREDGSDVPVAQRGSDPGFSPEPLDYRRVPDQHRMQHLERHDPL